MAKKPKKAQPARRKTKHPPNKITMLLNFNDSLKEARELISKGETGKACDILEALDRYYPDSLDVMNMLGYIYVQIHRPKEIALMVDRIKKAAPDNPRITLNIAQMYSTIHLYAMAFLEYQRFLELSPNDDPIEQLQDAINKIEYSYQDMLAATGLDTEDATVLVLAYEGVQKLFLQGKYVDVYKRAQEFLEHWPDYEPVLNCLSQAYFNDTNVEKAIEVAKRVYDINPESIEALSSLTQYTFLLGKKKEYQTWAERLVAQEAHTVDDIIRQMVALSLMSDDEQVLALFQRAKESDVLDESLYPHEIAFVYHYAAASTIFEGNDRDAVAKWKHANTLSPRLSIVLDNLAELEKPVSERLAPWALHATDYLPMSIVDGTQEHFETADPTGEKAQKRALQRYGEKYPLVVRLLPFLLERGDPQVRQLAFDLAIALEMTRTAEILRDFAFTTRGTDRMRRQAAQAAIRAGLIQPGLIELWIEGEWQEIVLLNFELYHQPFQHDPKTQRLSEQGLDALKQHDGYTAAKLLSRALELEPDSPDIMINLVAAYRYQEMHDEAEKLLFKIYEEYPDFFFGRVGMAHRHIERGETQEARKYLYPLLELERFQLSELRSLCPAFAHIGLVERNYVFCRSWIDMWEDIDPGYESIEGWRVQLEELRKSLKEEEDLKRDDLRDTDKGFFF